MPLNDIVGVDHVVVAVRDLDGAARAWETLGFTLSPRGVHSAKMGTGNHTIMLGEDYIELFAILAATEQNATTREFLASREGLERVAFTSRDAAAGAGELRARGLVPTGPLDFARPVAMQDGSTQEARFSTYQWPQQDAPAGVRLFACQHWTRDAVWLPELQRHANAARRIVTVEIATPQPREDAMNLVRLIDGEANAEPDGGYRVPSGKGRADFVFRTREAIVARLAIGPHASIPERGAAGLVLGSRDLAATKAALGSDAIAVGDALIVPPDAATGVLLEFVAS